MNRFEIKMRTFDDGFHYSIWDKKENDWHLSKCGYIKGTKEEMQRMCERLNLTTQIKRKKR